ncbi:MAG: hypothetical protein ACTSVB_04460 [Candidatus Heimdallarchaeaceae archaeon]
MKAKKGAIGDLQGIVMTLVVLGILIGVGLFVMESFRGQDVLSDTSISIANETGLFINATTSTVDHASDPGFNTFDVSICICNVTESGVGETSCAPNSTINSANYTVGSSGTLISASGYNFTDVACSYTYNRGDEAYSGVSDTIDATSEIPNWLTIIVIIAIVGILLAIVFVTLPRTGGGMGESGFTGEGSAVTAEI